MKPETRRMIAELLRDLHVYGGLALLCAGLWMWTPAAALSAVGIVLSYMGLFHRHSGGS